MQARKNGGKIPHEIYIISVDNRAYIVDGFDCDLEI